MVEHVCVTERGKSAGEKKKKHLLIEALDGTINKEKTRTSKKAP